MGTRLIDNRDRILIERTDAMCLEVIQKWHAVRSDSMAIRAAGALFVRMAGSWRSICKLLDGCSDQHEIEVFSNDAAAILRCLHDACLQAEYILCGDDKRGLSPDALGQLYVDFKIIERYRMATKGVTFLSAFAQKLAASPLRPEGEAALQQDFERVKGNYLQGGAKKPQLQPHWYKGNLPQIAEKLGREEEHFWLLRLLDSSIHAGPLAVLSGPTPRDANLVITAQHFICRIAKRLASDAGLEISQKSTEVFNASSDNFFG